MNIFQTFLKATRQGTYRSDSIYVGDMTRGAGKSSRMVMPLSTTL